MGLKMETMRIFSLLAVLSSIFATPQNLPKRDRYSLVEESNPSTSDNTPLPTTHAPKKAKKFDVIKQIGVVNHWLTLAAEALDVLPMTIVDQDQLSRRKVKHARSAFDYLSKTIVSTKQIVDNMVRCTAQKKKIMTQMYNYNIENLGNKSHLF